MKASIDTASTRRDLSVTVLCDFDGTIVPCETIAEIYRRFAAPSCRELVQGWIRGEISTQEELRGCFASIKATRAEMEALLCSIPVDSAFATFLGFCQERSYRFAIVSEGLTWIIDYILNRHCISSLTIYANQIHFDPDGVRFSFPWFDPETPMRGVSKPSIVRRYQAGGDKVVFIGDGLSDLEAVGVADLNYARGRLLRHCREQGIPAIGFSDFDDLLEKWVVP